MINTDETRNRTFAGWFILSVSLFSIGAVINNPVLSVVATGFALAAVGLGVARMPFLPVDHGVLGGFMTVVVVGVATTQTLGRFSVGANGYSLWVLFALTCGIATALSNRIDFRLVAVALAMATFLVSTLLILVPNWQPLASSDVFRAHVAAGNALEAGKNPYSDAVVFESGDPFKPDGTLIEGYPYPPPPLITYGAISSVTDPRLISFVSWLLFAGGLAVVALGAGPSGPTALGALALLSTLPIWRLALFMSWTEPLSVALFAAALLAIARRKKWGWVLLGLAFASKQYLIFVALALLIYRSPDRKTALGLTFASAGAVAVIPALFGPVEYYNAVIGNALAIGFRPDTLSINGAIAALGGDWQLSPLLLVPVMALMIFALHRLKLQPGMVPAAGVLLLGAAFLTTSAFPNYWMLVAALAGMASIVAVSHQEDRRGQSPAESGGNMEVDLLGKQVPEDPVPGDSPELRVGEVDPEIPA